MDNLPKIIVKKDIEQEVKLFYNFLNHPEFPEKRYNILNAFPEVKNSLNKPKDESVQILDKFISNFYKKMKILF